MDEGLSRAVAKVFVELYREGLIYKDKRLVNWDPKLKTAISDLEVQQVETKGHLWHIKYPIEGSDEFVIVATTRPETMLGDVAVAVHPENERLRHLIGKTAILPLVGRRIPIIGDDYADPEKGTGAVKITPAHDFNDFEVGRRHGLPLVNVLDIEGGLDLKDNAEFLQGPPPSDALEETLALHGLDRFAARKKIIERLEAIGLLDKIEQTTHVVPHGDRSGAVLEPFLTDQWYVDAKTLAAARDHSGARRQDLVRAHRNGRRRSSTGWRTSSPGAFRGKSGGGTRFRLGTGPTAKSLSPKARMTRSRTRSPTTPTSRRSRSRTATTSPPIRQRRSRFANEYLHRDEDVLDTWFSSALWPFSTLGWPDETPELKRYYPTSVLVTGFDIIFFWVARMMMMGLHFMQKERPGAPLEQVVPFPTVYIHALVRDATGAKMSKSKGNVIDPLELIDEYGADALALHARRDGAQGRDIKLVVQRVAGYRNFATKLWNAARFAEINGCAHDPDFDPHHAKETLNRWIAHETANTGREVTAALEAYKFNDAAARDLPLRLEHLLRLVSGTDQAGAHRSGRRGQERNARGCGLGARRNPETASPVHAVHHRRAVARYRGTQGAKRDHMLALDAWPEHDGLDDDAAEAEIGWVVDLVTAIRSVRVEMNIPPAPCCRWCWRRFAANPRPRAALVGIRAASRARHRYFVSPTPCRKARCSSSCAARSPRCRSRA